MLRKVCGVRGDREGGKWREMAATSHSPLEATATAPRIHLDTTGEVRTKLYTCSHLAKACNFLLNGAFHFVAKPKWIKEPVEVWRVLKSEPLGMEASKSWLQQAKMLHEVIIVSVLRIAEFAPAVLILERRKGYLPNV